jgi:hypothetical protein
MVIARIQEDAELHESNTNSDRSNDDKIKTNKLYILTHIRSMRT